MKGTGKQDTLPAVALMFVIGMGTSLKSLDYDMGMLTDMGPGFFPLALGLTLIAIALLILVVPQEAEPAEEPPEAGAPEPVRRHAYRTWLFLIGAMAAFVVFGNYGGLVPGTFLLVFVSALADRANTPRDAFKLAAFVTLFTVLVFHYGMQFQFPLFGWGTL